MLLRGECGILAQAEVAPGPAEAAAEVGRGTKGNTQEASHAEIRVFGKGDANIKEDLFEARDGELGLDLGR